MPSVSSDDFLAKVFTPRTPTEKEEWRPAVGFPDYEVSNQGRVRNRVGRGPNTQPGRVLAGGLSDGYRVYSLYAPDRVQRAKSGHRLVAEAFLPPPPDDGRLRHINHKNFNRDDNRPENLEWLTRSENALYSIRSGRMNTKLDLSKARQLRSLRAGGACVKGLARRFGVSVATVRSVVRGLRWPEPRRAEG